MNILIVEDEIASGLRMLNLIKELNPNAIITGPIDNTIDLEELLTTRTFDLIVSDIELSDGKSILIYEKLQLKSPIIFTTAYNEHALQAFNLNSIHYLLKPIDINMLKLALEKHHQVLFPIKKLENKAVFKPQGFTFNIGQKIVPVLVNDILFFESVDSQTYVYTKNAKKLMCDFSLDVLEPKLQTLDFFRLNRSFICNREQITHISPGLNGKIYVNLIAKKQELVSREKSKSFKAWLNFEVY